MLPWGSALRLQGKIAKAVNTLEVYGIKPAVKKQLQQFFQNPDSRILYHANPKMIAAYLHLSVRETLQILVFALKEGLVTLNWDIQCPVCHGIDFQAKSLGDLRTIHTCPRCKDVHATNADDLVRVTFSIDQRLRRLEAAADDPDFRDRIDTQYGIVSGHEMLTLQTFRDLFPRETIPPNESLVIRRVAILFTDLTGSTALYARRGDAHAYSLVRQHFEVLFKVVDAHNGAVVKTIGDAVMAAFTIPIDALEAAISMHTQLNTLNQQLSLSEADQLILKVGIEVGPCISVTLNGHPDYFGTTVNTAARVQATSQGNDIVVTDSLLIDPLAADRIKGCPIQSRSLLLKGLETPVVVHSIQFNSFE
jgi:class 3 adenylate cyclase